MGAVIAKRFARFGLKINAEKTRLVRFGRPPRGGGGSGDKPGTFDFLGFTHYWEKFQAMLRTFPLLPARIVHSRL